LGGGGGRYRTLHGVAVDTRAKLNKSELSKISVRQPPTKAEQTAIATILSDMDGDITVLEAKVLKPANSSRA
jgi:type I restriction enzyme S subunit